MALPALTAFSSAINRRCLGITGAFLIVFLVLRNGVKSNFPIQFLILRFAFYNGYSILRLVFVLHDSFKSENQGGRTPSMHYNGTIIARSCNVTHLIAFLHFGVSFVLFSRSKFPYVY